MNQRPKWLNLAYPVFPMCVTPLSMTDFLKKTLHFSCHNLQIVCHKLSLNWRHVQTRFWKRPLIWLDCDKESPHDHVSDH